MSGSTSVTTGPDGNFELLNDVVLTIPIMAKDAAGNVVPAPAGITPTVSSSDPSIAALIVGTSYTLNATGLGGAGVDGLVTNVSITLDDGSLTPEVNVWDVVEDLTPQSVFSNLLAATSVAQAVPQPAAPAPTATPTPTPTPTPGP